METAIHADAQATLANEHRRAIAAIRRRLEKLELEHLRSHAAELAEKLERAEEELQAIRRDLAYAEQCAISWRDDFHRLMEETFQDGGSIGLAKDGSLHIVKGSESPAHG